MFSPRVNLVVALKLLPPESSGPASLFRPHLFPFIALEVGENVMRGTIPWLSHRGGYAFVAGKFILVR